MADTLTMPGVIDLSRLADPFPADAISWRVGATNSDKTKGLALAYIDARDVMNRLDEVCTPAKWQDEFVETAKGRVLCRIGILCVDGWVWKGDGAGDSDVEAEKGAISDALKRAAVHWGIGRYLYSMPATWVQIEQRGKTSVIADNEYPRLAAVASGQRITAEQAPPIRHSAQPFIDGARVALRAATGDLDALNMALDDIKAKAGWQRLNVSEQRSIKDVHRELTDGLRP